MKTFVQEFKDKRGENRMRVVARENGEIISSSTEGYTSKSSMISSAIRSSVAILSKYAPNLLK